MTPAEQAALEAEFRRGWVREAAQLEIKERQLGKAYPEKRRSIDGIGQFLMSVPADSFHYWGQREGYGCWRDRQFIREYGRDNPQCKVNSGGTKLQWGFEGDGSGYKGSSVKFRKTYQ